MRVLLRDPADNSTVNESRLIDLIHVLMKDGGSYGDIFVEKGFHDRLVVANGSITDRSLNKVSGAGFRVLGGDQVGFGSTSDLSDDSLAKCAAGARLKVKGVGTRPMEFGRMKRVRKAPATDLDRFIMPMQSACDEVLLHEPSIVEVMCQADIVHRSHTLINSEGTLLSESRTTTDLHVWVTAERDNRRVTGHRFCENLEGLRAATQSAGVDAVEQLDARGPEEGVFPVVLGPGWCGMLFHEAVGHALEGDFFVNGESVYASSVGLRIASDNVTLIDDGSLAYGRGSSRWDDEGTPTRRSVLIENGVLKQYLTDRRTASLLGTRSSGNGRRAGFDALPLPRMTNTILLAGSDHPEEVIRSVERGVYVAAIGEGVTDARSGDFRFDIERGYWIESGRLDHPLKGATVSGNGPETLAKIRRVGSDLKIETGIGHCYKRGQRLPIGVGQPTVLIDGLRIESSEGVCH